MRVFGTSGTVDRVSEHMYVQNIPLDVPITPPFIINHEYLFARTTVYVRIT